MATSGSGSVSVPGMSIAMRAFLALFLMVGFYLLAVGIAALLFYIPYAEVVYAHRLHIKIALGCVLGGIIILWSVVPRIDKFEAPGPLLTRDGHPQLFAEIEGVAHATRQAMPAEVYLVHDINAWVSQRGGIMGFGSRRVMGLGLPLMKLLTCSQFRAVLAHEFGHYHGGDTKLGPWIFKTRNAIIRTVSTLNNDSLLRLPFLWYGKMFLRITHAVSRRQEYVADELAARTVGARPLIAGLRTVHGAGLAFHNYWVNECTPVFNAGYRPPLLAGFEQFLQSVPIVEAINRQLAEEMEGGKSDPYNTHPPLKERIAALESLPMGDLPANDPLALTLLNDLAILENELLVCLAGAENAAKLKSISWTEVGTQVYFPMWVKLFKANAVGLRGVTPGSLPTLAADLKTFATRLVDADGQKVTEEDAEPLASAIIGAALAVQLAKQGAKLDALPGKPVTVTFNHVVLEPFGLMQSLATGTCTSETWQQQCVQAGFRELDLGKLPENDNGPEGSL